jgi:bifunctional enzyme CysN/CysC
LTSMPALRLTTCGSVDDGKSTLIGRLLYDAELVPTDRLVELARDSRGRPVGAEGLDFSLLLDGLAAEREQGITIDVAYRYFTTAKRRVVVADAPGHQQYTRNMATAASGAQAALLLVDARKGVLAQTRRHAIILSLMGVRHVALAVNKMDLAAFSEARFAEVVSEFRAAMSDWDLNDVTAIPTAAMSGANVVHRSPDMAWYRGPTLLEWIDTVPGSGTERAQSFRMPIQWINRANADFRGLCGTIAAGRIRPGDRVAAARSGHIANVARIVTMDGDLAEAAAGQAITLVLDGELDAGRGDMLFDPAAPPAIADQFAANLICFSDRGLSLGRPYYMRIGTDLVAAEITALKRQVSTNDPDDRPASGLAANDIAACDLATVYPVSFDSYRDNQSLGGFILIDQKSRETVAAGMIEAPLRRATNLIWHDFDINRERRAAQKTQRPAIVWFTGLSGAGKSTIANVVERHLHGLGRHTFVLDGDNIRHGLSKDLGFSDDDRAENIRRVANVARLMAEAGLIVLVALISPFRRDREMAREIAGDVDFLEVFVDAPLSVCEERDPRGLYSKARHGQIAQFTGVDSRYEPPQAPHLHLRTDRDDVQACVAQVVTLLSKMRI